MRPLDWVPGSRRAARDLKCSLERELKSKLHLPWVAGVLYLAEIGSVTEVAVRIQELSMVEDVEELSSELEVLVLTHR